jgi:hypothetical protein
MQERCVPGQLPPERLASQSEAEEQRRGRAEAENEARFARLA